MSGRGIPAIYERLEHILPPELIRRSIREDRFERRVNNWLLPWDGVERVDAALLSVPFSRASQRGDNGAAGAPNAIRMAFPLNTTYSADFDVDLAPLTVRDVGDVRLHMTDVLRSHAMIEAAVVELYGALAPPLLLSVGGDHSITCPLVQGVARSHAGARIGIVHFDAHNDVRNFEDGGPTNGTPFRGILEGPARVDGRNLVQIGIHGFMNSAWYQGWCRERGVTIVSARAVRRRGIADVMAEAITRAGDGTDLIYVSVDIDVLAAPFAPGTGSASPEGMEVWDLLEGLFVLGGHPKVRALDLVCIDPLRDVRDITAKAGASILLTFLGGRVAAGRLA